MVEHVRQRACLFDGVDDVYMATCDDVTLRGFEFSEGYPRINERREIELMEKYLSGEARQQAVLA